MEVIIAVILKLKRNESKYGRPRACPLHVVIFINYNDLNVVEVGQENV